MSLLSVQPSELQSQQYSTKWLYTRFIELGERMIMHALCIVYRSPIIADQVALYSSLDVCISTASRTLTDTCVFINLLHACLELANIELYIVTCELCTGCHTIPVVNAAMYTTLSYLHDCLSIALFVSSLCTL